MSAEDKVFDPETLTILKVAFDEACLDLAPGQRIPSVRTKLAQRILSKAGQGERDPVRLRAFALMNVVSPSVPQRTASQDGASLSSVNRMKGGWRSGGRSKKNVAAP